MSSAAARQDVLPAIALEPRQVPGPSKHVQLVLSQSVAVTHVEQLASDDIEGEVRTSLGKQNEIQTGAAQQVFQLDRQARALVRLQATIREWKRSQIDVRGAATITCALAVHDGCHLGGATAEGVQRLDAVTLAQERELSGRVHA